MAKDKEYLKIIRGYKIIPSNKRRVNGWVLEREGNEVRLNFYKLFVVDYIVYDSYRKELTERFQNILSLNRFNNIVDSLSIEVSGDIERIYISEEMLEYIHNGHKG